MDNNLINSISKLALSTVNKILVFDPISDKLESFSYKNNGLSLEKEESLTEYLNNLSNVIKKEYLTDYMNSISVPKLEAKENDGSIITTFNYKTLNNNDVINTSTLFNYKGNKCVLTLSMENIAPSAKEDNLKYNTLTLSVADSMLKIHNLFNLNEKALSSTKNVQEYIDAVFSSLTKDYPELKKSFNNLAANVSGRSLDTILIVDDDALTRSMIKKIFDQDEYKIVMAANGKEAIDYVEENSKKGIEQTSDHIVGIFLDLTMPVLDGFAVLDYLSERNYLNRIPVIIISGDYEKETKIRVYNYNIADMLEKPFDFDVVKHRIGNFINLYKSSNSLNDLINNQTESLKDIIDAYIKSYYYDYKKDTDNISKYISVLAKEVMNDYPEYNLTDSKIEKICSASMYYDIGFYSIPRTVLMKNGNYSEEDIKYIKNYPLFGSRVVNYLLSLTSDEEYKKYAENICKFCHENFDGTGYPSNIKGDKIPVEAQIAAIVIAYNNLKKSGSNAKDAILKKSGTMFNPKLVISFMKIADKMDEEV